MVRASQETGLSPKRGGVIKCTAPTAPFTFPAGRREGPAQGSEGRCEAAWLAGPPLPGVLRDRKCRPDPGTTWGTGQRFQNGARHPFHLHPPPQGWPHPGQYCQPPVPDAPDLLNTSRSCFHNAERSLQSPSSFLCFTVLWGHFEGQLR